MFRECIDMLIRVYVLTVSQIICHTNDPTSLEEKAAWTERQLGFNSCFSPFVRNLSKGGTRSNDANQLRYKDTHSHWSSARRTLSGSGDLNGCEHFEAGEIAASLDPGVTVMGRIHASPA